MFAIVDTRPLVAFFDRAERHHRWIAKQIEEIEPPLLVCEPVLAEAVYLLRRYCRLTTRCSISSTTALLELRSGSRSMSRVAQIAAKVPGHADVIGRRVYRTNGGNPRRHAVVTLDSDFWVYRKHGRVPLTLVHPAAS